MGLDIGSKDIIIGIDEVGRGSLIGDIVVCATVSCPIKIDGVSDSKALTPEKRSDIFRSAIELNVPFAVSYGTMAEIDSNNVLFATMKAMERLSISIFVKILKQQNREIPSLILSELEKIKQIDGGEYYFQGLQCGNLVKFFGNWDLPFESWWNFDSNNSNLDNEKNCHFNDFLGEDFSKTSNKHAKDKSRAFFLLDGSNIFRGILNGFANIVPIIKGDSKFYEIGLSSILAKTIRDEHIKNSCHPKHPQYGWAFNFGYGTKEHMDAIDKYGMTDFHRMSFLKGRFGKKTSNGGLLF